jgi:hypothetical protein
MKMIPMKTHFHFPLCFGVLLALLAGGTMASAQSNDAPGPAAYPAFSGFIATRNIFDPNRYPRGSRPARTYRTQRTQRSAPAFMLVGTMSYEKGMFAFFDGNQPDLRKALYQSNSNSIAGFTVAEITLAGVKLQTADKKQTVRMKIGEVMRQEGGGWQLAGQGELFAGTSVGPVATPSAAADSSPETSAAPSPALEGNDILKKLMQQREQELK